MEAFELILFLLVAVVASSLLSQVLRGVSLPLVQILIGAVIAFFVTTPLSSGIDAELLLILFIAPLHFNESRHADSAELWRNRRGIASLVTGLVLVTMVAVGFSLHALIPAIPLAAALALGAALGSTDAMAVTALTKDMRFGKRHESLLAGEALFNDVTGTIGFHCAIAVVAAGGFSLAHAGEEFALELFGGMAVGALLGLAFWALLAGVRRAGLNDPTVHVVLELLAPFIIFLIGEHLGVGGVITVVMSGMVFSLLPQRMTAATAHQRLQAQNAWKTIEFVLNGVIFVLLGMQLPRVLTPALADGALGTEWLVLGIVVVTFVLEAVRFAWILGMDVVHAVRCGRRVRSCFTRKSLKSTLAMAFAGPKGGITLSLMLTIPLVVTTGGLFPYRAELLSLASGVILCTLLLANYVVPALVPREGREKRSRAYVDAEIVLLERVIASIQADAHLTGMVKGDASDAEGAPILPVVATGDVRSLAGAGAEAPRGIAPSDGAGANAGAGSSAGVALLIEVDEPATAIVMKHYADRIADLALHASPEAAARGRALAAQCNELYERSDALAHALDDLEEEGDDALAGISAHMAALRAVGDAVDDIQDQALARELELIKEARRAGELSAEHARALRNDVYVQQMMLG